MSKKSLSKKIKLAKISKIRIAPRWVDIRKFGLKKARTRRIFISRKKWRKAKIKI
jgi:ribosomal protein L39E